MTHLERQSIPTKKIISNRRVSAGKGAAPSVYLPPQVVEGAPIILDIEEFQYQYKCGHCGHEWSEKKSEEHREN